MADTTLTPEAGVSTFRNPVIRGFNPDPTICVVPATDTTPTTYFLSTSTFNYFPGAAIYTSTDLINWKLIGHALTRRSQLDLRTSEPGAGSWASTLRYREDEKRFYLANGLFHRYRPANDERIFPRGFYVWTDNIWDENAWSDPIYFDNPGFDQDLFWDDACSPPKVYLSTTHRLADRPVNSKLKDFAIHISEIDLPSGRTLTPPVVIRQSPYGIAEGSHIICRNGWYYLFTAEGGTEAGHQEWVFRSREGPLGPWEGTGKPLWYNGPDEEVQRTGHADVFEDGQGRWWAVLLGVRPLKMGGKWLEPHLGRETFLVKVDWVDDWPIFNGGKNISIVTEGRDNVVQAAATGSGALWHADLTKDDLEPGWYQKHTPVKKQYTLKERPGYLRLYGNCYGLSSPEAPAMLLRKQTSSTDCFKCTMNFNPRKVGYEAGVVLWWSEFSCCTVGVRLSPQVGATMLSQRAIVRTRRSPELGPGTAWGQEFLGAPTNGCEEGQYELKIQCRYDHYILSVSGLGVQDVKVDDLTATPPVGASFAGAMLGVYSFGKGEPVLDPADFSDISIEEKLDVDFRPDIPWSYLARQQFYQRE